jgi:sensor histidine kinase YesM
MLEFAAMNEFQNVWLLVYLYEAVLLLWMYKGLLKPPGSWKLWQKAALPFLLAAYVLAKWRWENYILFNIIVMLCYGCAILGLFTDVIWENLLWLSAVYTVCIELGRILVYGSIYITGNIGFYDQHNWLLRILVQILKLLFVAACRKLVCEYSRFRVRFIDDLLIVMSIIQLIFMHYRRRLSIVGSMNLAFEVQTFLILGLGVFVLLVAMLYHIKSFLQQERLKKIQDAMAENYHAIHTKSEVDAEIRRIYHDLKHQLAAMDFSEVPADRTEQKKLADRLMDHVADLESVTQSGSPLLDSLLNHKLIDAREKQIHMELFVETVPYEFLDSMDLCSIFGNALDNAIEAAAQLPDSKDRWVRVKTALIQGIWVLKVENSCIQKPEIERGAYISSKPGPRREGIGISSICYCAEKYHGSVDITAEDRVFTLRVTVPVLA